ASALERALGLEEKEPAHARAEAEKLTRGRGAAFKETRAALLLAARVGGGSPAERFALVARALTGPDASALDAAHRLLAPGWRTDRPMPAALSELARRTEEGDVEAATAASLIRFEEALARRPSATSVIAALPHLDRALRAAPASLVVRLARAMEALAADDAVTAGEDLSLLREVAPD